MHKMIIESFDGHTFTAHATPDIDVIVLDHAKEHDSFFSYLDVMQFNLTDNEKQELYEAIAQRVREYGHSFEQSKQAYLVEQGYFLF